MALMRSVVLLLLACFLFSGYSRNGVEGGRRLSKEEDPEFEKQLKLLNKPAVKTIKTGFGDIYDCVDFYKQPAFDHPLLKNHTFHFQMRPSVPEGITGETMSSKANTEVLDVGLKGVGCPMGTVPIRRVTKDDLIRTKLHYKKYGSKYSALTAENPGLHYAVVKTAIPGMNFNGGGTDISLYNPSVKASQYSSARVKIENGRDSIQAGWIVNPTLYGDYRTRLFIHTTAGQSQCFNTQCPGFVIVNTDIPLDMVLDPVSRSGGPIYSTNFFIYKDQANGNWWLEIGPNNTQIGFWPQRIFTGLAGMATSVEWGGEVSGPTDIPSAKMGHGDYPVEENHRYSAFCRKITVVNDAHKVVDPDRYTDQFADTYVYKSIDEGVLKGQGHLGFFGGPGGIKGK